MAFLLTVKVERKNPDNYAVAPLVNLSGYFFERLKIRTGWGITIAINPLAMPPQA